MTTFLCPLHKQYLSNNLDAAFRHASKALQAVDDQCQFGDYQAAYWWAGQALDTSQLILRHQSGWSIHSIMQYTAATITMTKLSFLMKMPHTLEIIQHAWQQLNHTINTNALHKLSWAIECQTALKLHEETIRMQLQEIRLQEIDIHPRQSEHLTPVNHAEEVLYENRHNLH